jgi:hypothetical protein
MLTTSAEEVVVKLFRSPKKIRRYQEDGSQENHVECFLMIH